MPRYAVQVVKYLSQEYKMSYRVATITIEGISPYSSSRIHGTPFLSPEEKKDHAGYDKRTWMEKAHFDSEGKVFVPKKALLESVIEASKRRGTKVAGRGNKTFGSLMEGGIIVLDDLYTGAMKSDLRSATFNCHAKGDRKDHARVPRIFPMLDKWGGKIKVVLTDPNITRDEFEASVRDAGVMVGVGRYRPANRGDNGRFVVKTVEWTETDVLTV
jgi:hypothetical protein